MKRSDPDKMVFNPGECDSMSGSMQMKIPFKKSMMSSLKQEKIREK
ncbi:MAG: hypothetical protein M0Q91_16695 [Methanoregula sp.]|jgi:hypothetical protein|nr:hypothetical protein [Methanoregula sp.]